MGASLPLGIDINELKGTSVMLVEHDIGVFTDIRMPGANKGVKSANEEVAPLSILF